MVKRLEYASRDIVVGEDIPLFGNWKGLFLPGRRVHMSMVFGETQNLDSCPQCLSLAQGLGSAELRCESCGMCFQRAAELPELGTSQEVNPLKRCATTDLNEGIERKRPKVHHMRNEEDEPKHFQRMRFVLSEHLAKWCGYMKNYYIYMSCVDPGAYYFGSSLEGDRSSSCSMDPHDRYIMISGQCPLDVLATDQRMPTE